MTSPDNDSLRSEDAEVPFDDGQPVAQSLALKSANEVAREALNRAKAAARARGLYPGKQAFKPILEPQVSGARAGGRDPKSLSETLGNLLVQRGWNQDVAVGGVIGRWAAIVGEDIAAHCTAETFENSVLTVRAHSTAWATQLKFLSPDILRRVSADIGDGVVKELRILGPDTRNFTKGRFSVKGRGARDTWG